MKVSLCVLIALSACAAQPPILQRTVAPSVAGSLGPIELHTWITARVVVVAAMWSRECRREVVELMESGGGMRRRQAGTVITACPLPATNIPVVIALGSGAHVTVPTDAGGHVVFVLPADEREASASVEGTPVPPAVAIAATPPRVIGRSDAPQRSARHGFPGVRDAVNRCGTQLGRIGVVAVRLVIAGDGHITRWSLDRIDGPLQSCLDRELAAVRFDPNGQSERTIPVSFTISPPSD